MASAGDGSKYSKEQCDFKSYKDFGICPKYKECNKKHDKRIKFSKAGELETKARAKYKDEWEDIPRRFATPKTSAGAVPVEGTGEELNEPKTELTEPEQTETRTTAEEPELISESESEPDSEPEAGYYLETEKELAEANSGSDEDSSAARNGTYFNGTVFPS